MGFQVERARVGGRGSAVRASLVGAIVLFVVAGGLFAAIAGRDAGADSGAAAEAADASLAAAASRFGDAAAPTPTPDPTRSAVARLDCHGLEGGRCRAISRAALATLGLRLDQVAGVETWASLVCNDQYDCPPGFLDGDTVPLGSVAVDVGAPTRTWINVVGRLERRTGGAERAHPTEAWVVAWR